MRLEGRARRALIGIGTVLWLLLTALRFYGMAAAREDPSHPSESNPQIAGQVSKILYFKEALTAYADQPMLRTFKDAHVLDEVFGQPEKLLQDAVEAAPGDVVDRLRLAIVLADEGHLEEARKQLSKATKNEQFRTLAEALEAIYLAPELPRDAGALEATLQRDLNEWYRDAAVVKLYQRMGRESQAREMRAAMRQQGERDAMVLGAAGLLIVCFLGLGCVLLLLFFLLPQVTRLRDNDFNTARWDWAGGWVVFIFWEFIQVLIGYIVLVTKAHTVPVLLGVQVLIYALTVTAIVLLVRSTEGARPSQLGLHTQHLVRNVLLGIATWICALPVLAMVAVVLLATIHKNPSSSNPVFQFFENPPSGWILFGFYLLVGVVGPIFEELLFRGVLLSSFRLVMRPAYAVVLSGFIFAIVHGDLPALPFLFILGCFLGGIFERTGSLVPSCVAHIMQNSIAFIATLYLVR